MRISFGSDPEFMLQDKDGNLRSAIGVIPGTKDERHDLGDGHFAYYDNVLAEASIRPADTKEGVVESFRQCFERYAKIASPLVMVPRASATYPDDECKHRDALKFGCSPEFCAYEVRVIEAPEVPVSCFRSGGGHVHIGYDGGVDIPKGKLSNQEWEETLFKVAFDRIAVARMCDIFLGIPSLILDKDPTSPARRQLYGGAGSHRACPKYGVEYRSLSNFWLARPSLVELVFDLATVATKVAIEDGAADDIWDGEVDPEELRATINTADISKVDKFMDVVRHYAPAELVARIQSEADKPFDPDFYAQWEIKP